MGKFKKIFILLFILFVVNFLTAFYFINLFRRDYALGTLNLINFHFIFLILSFLILNGIFISIGAVLFKKADWIKENRIAEEIFNVETKTNKILTFLAILLLIYVTHYVPTLIHEFGHGIASILTGGYFNYIEIHLDTGGLTSGVLFLPTTLTGVFFSLSGLLAEAPFLIISLLILFSYRKRSNSSGLLFMIVMISLLATLLYFSFYPLFNIRSDALSIANHLKISPFIIFLIFLPPFIAAILILVKFIHSFYKNNLNRKFKFVWIYIISLIAYFVLMGSLAVINELFIPLPPILIIY